MATNMPFSVYNLKRDFGFVDYGVLREFLYRNMMRIGNFIWVWCCKFLLYLFGFLDRYLERLEADDGYEEYDSGCVTKNPEEKTEVLKSDSDIKNENFKMFSGFLFENKGTEELTFVENVMPVLSTSKYEVRSRNDISGFLEKPKTMSFTVQEMHLEWKDDFIVENGNKYDHDSAVYSGNGFRGICDEKGKLFLKENDQISNDQLFNSDHIRESDQETGEKTGDSVQEYPKESDFGNLEKVDPNKNVLSCESEANNIDLGSGPFRFSNSELEFSTCTEEAETEDSVQVSSKETNFENEEMLLSNENNILRNKKIDKKGSGEFVFSLMNPDLVLSDQIKEVSFTSEIVQPVYDDEILVNVEESILDDSRSLDDENDDESIKLGPKLQFSTTKGEEKGNILEDESEDGDEFDILLHHQETIEKLKMEMKNSKTKGLPTILENCESPKLAEDLKPLKIDEKKLEHKDRVDEIYKVYKSYSEKMRKLDILNYQTLNAISFMQLKDPNQQVSGQKSSSMQSLRLSNLRRVHVDPTLKSIFEMHKKLESVYVGQLCLSWETLRWEYEQSKELLAYDPEGLRSYNLVAGEFQKFQVLIQRFVENEEFVGPRVQNYAKNRCEFRVFLQVPIIKEDSLKDKRVNNIGGEYKISVSELSDIISETVRVFWEFLRADHKDEKFSKLKGLSPNHLELQDPLDSELLMEIKTNLHLKEKRLKDILRTENCIVKMFRKQQERRTNLDLLYAQMDLKLVLRVLNMLKLTTDQLIWCQNKLQKVMFSNRKVHVEPSVLLFPI